MKSVDRLILKAKQLYGTNEKHVGVVFIEKESDDLFWIQALLWNGRKDARSASEQIVRNFSTREEVEAFLEQLFEDHGKTKSTVILDSSDGIPD